MNINNFKNENCMQLEPRLIEYINKKIYYKKHNINTDMPIETQYMITKEDLKLIKDYYNKKNVYSYDNKEKYMNFIEPKKPKFQSSELQNIDCYSNGISVFILCFL